MAVGTLGAGLERTLAREAKALLGGDLELRAARPLPAEAEAALGRLAAPAPAWCGCASWSAWRAARRAAAACWSS